MSMEISKEDIQDIADYWHLKYEGDMELGEFMQSQLRWTDMELDYFLVTGKFPGEGCSGGPDMEDEIFNG